ncbi:hypothetical protein NX059_001177 [Plenodomus lindquistii]|nr:hypothetical protein NX059_001177 [Plenodomus lindquistii]
MAQAVPVPAHKLVPGSLIDPKLFSKLLEDIRKHAKVAEFPLRKTFHATNASVYTNHFALKFDPKLPLYEYEIVGVPRSVGKRKQKLLVSELIDRNEFLRSHQAQFATDFLRTIVS